MRRRNICAPIAILIPEGWSWEGLTRSNTLGYRLKMTYISDILETSLEDKAGALNP
jgi:hypothetical protein